mgnify:CR=1 FL=1
MRRSERQMTWSPLLLVVGRLTILGNPSSGDDGQSDGDIRGVDLDLIADSAIHLDPQFLSYLQWIHSYSFSYFSQTAQFAKQLATFEAC